MKRLIIFLSKHDKFLDSALKMKKEFKINVEVLYIENFYKLKYDRIITDNDIIYFLCNGTSVFKIVEILKDKGCFIFNKKYWLNNFNKYEVQSILQTNNIPVPSLQEIGDFNCLKFPLFCKEKIHTGITFQVYNKNTLQRFFEKFNKNDFYFEDSISGNKDKTDEFKIYYVDGKLFEKANESNIKKETMELSKKISLSLDNMDVFSADVIHTKYGIMIIDVNPASGFYLSDSGRKGLMNFIKKIF